MLRTFIAAEVSPDVRSQAARLMERVGRRVSGVRWVEPHNLHWTLKFLGDVADEELRQVCDATARAAQEQPSFEVECHGLGAFPTPDRPRTLWLGVRRGGDQMEALYDRLETELAPVGFRRENRRFRPHLTLGRVRDGAASAELAELVRQHADFPGGAMEIDALVVFRSTLSREGPTYDPLATIELRGRRDE